MLTREVVLIAIYLVGIGAVRSPDRALHGECGSPPRGERQYWGYQRPPRRREGGGGTHPDRGYRGRGRRWCCWREGWERRPGIPRGGGVDGGSGPPVSYLPEIPGGKGVATTLGVVLAAMPVVGGLVLLVRPLVAVVWRYSSLAALAAAAALPSRWPGWSTGGRSWSSSARYRRR